MLFSWSAPLVSDTVRPPHPHLSRSTRLRVSSSAEQKQLVELVGADSDYRDCPNLLI